MGKLPCEDVKYRSGQVIRPRPVSLEFDFHSYEHKDKVDVNLGKLYTCSADISNGQLDVVHHLHGTSYRSENELSTLGRTGEMGHMGYLFSVQVLYGVYFTQQDVMKCVLCRTIRKNSFFFFFFSHPVYDT